VFYQEEGGECPSREQSTWKAMVRGNTLPLKTVMNPVRPQLEARGTKVEPAGEEGQADPWRHIQELGLYLSAMGSGHELISWNK
jgi:hypothetical protein